MELEKVIAIVAEVMNVEPEKITASTKIVDDLQADSLDVADIIMHIEDAYHITIPENETVNPNMTVGEMAEKLESR